MPNARTTFRPLGLTTTPVGRPVLPLDVGLVTDEFAQSAVTHVEHQEPLDQIRQTLAGSAIAASIGTKRFASPEEFTRSLEETLKKSRDLVSLRANGLKSEEVLPWVSDRHPQRPKIYGVPAYARLVVIGERDLLLSSDPSDTIVLSGSTVFRHYTRQETLESIIVNGALIPGPMPFTSSSADGFYQTLVGAFVALSQHMPRDAGVPNNRFFVDLEFYNGTGLLQLSDYGFYFMVPGVPKERDWYLEYYRQWLEAGAPDKTASQMIAVAKNYQPPWNSMFEYVDQFMEIKAQGGFPEPSRIPIRVVNAGEIPKR